MTNLKYQFYASFILALLFIFISYSCFATTIVVIQTTKDVAIAADSKSVIKNYQGEIKSITKESKIFQKEDVLFASSSFVEDIKEGFDVNKIIYEALQNFNPLIQEAKNIGAILSKALKKEWIMALDQAPPFRDSIESGRQKLSTNVLIASYENNQPIVILMTFRGAFDESGKLVIRTTMETCPGTCPPHNNFTILLGASKAINEYLGRYGAPSDMNTAELAKFLIQLEIDAGTPSVGPPIDVVKISERGITWLSDKDAKNRAVD